MNLTATPPRFRLAPRAARRVAALLAAPAAGGAAPAALRVAVLAGGCNGLQYRFDLDETIAADDVVIEEEGARVAIDPVSLDLLAGAELDYVEELMGAYFKVKNPNATSSCGCGTSFAVE
ncbi:MAG: HesB/IscA family protein [Acidibrevibacterium sp.]|uniref:HesB/IscA family protein n=1 Tax=Acidibrevibacterium sp. TaxID=2606776 RepID=UPI003D07EADC